jgi:undecaprenyl-diphosphatase
MQRQCRNMWLVVLAPALGVIVSTILKLLFDRQRPEESLHLVEVSTASFPSGHAMLSAIVYLTLGLTLAATRYRKREKTYIVIIAFS